MLGVETGTYGAVEDLTRNRVNLNKVITHWPDLLTVVGSLVTNQVRAYDLRCSRSTDGSRRPSICCAWSPQSTIPTGGR